MEDSPEYISRRSALSLTALSVGSAVGLGSVPETMAAEECDSGLTDISGHPFEEAIRTLVDEGIISGYPDCTFRPTETVTRAECAAMIVEAFSLQTLSTPPDFSDIDGHWAESQIRTAAGKGFFTGYPDGTFRPDQTIRRVELVVALAEGLEYAGGNPDQLAEQYSDADAIANWAREQVAAAHAAWDGIENPNTASAFEPERDGTRAEAAKYVHNAIQNQDGGGDTIPAPEAQFELTPSSPGTGESVTFDATSSTPSDGLDQYDWSFDDGASGTGQTVTHSYTTSGTYDVTLSVQTSNGKRDERTKTVTVTSPPGDGGDGGDDGSDGGDDGGDETVPAPEAQFDFSPELPEAGEEIIFDGGLSAPTDSQIAVYGWQFDNTQKTGRTQTHVYESPGEYEVTLGIETIDGQTDTRTRVVSISEASDDGTDDEDGPDDTPKPTARFNVTPGFPTPGEEVTFDAGTSTPGDAIERYQWTFADESSGTGRTATHSFSTSGEYDVTLGITTTDGAVDTETRTISVLASPGDDEDDDGGDDSNDSPAPEAKFSMDPSSPSVGDTVSFDASASTPDKEQVSGYGWLFEDQTKARGQSVTHTYDSAGTYTVRLGIQTKDQKRDTQTKTITVTSSDDSDDGKDGSDDGPIGGGGDSDGGGIIGGGDDSSDGQPGGDDSGPGGGFLGGSGDTDSSDNSDRETPFDDAKDLDGETNASDGQDGSGASLTIKDPEKIATGLLSGGVLTHVYRRFRSP